MEKTFIAKLPLRSDAVTAPQMGLPKTITDTLEPEMLYAFVLMSFDEYSTALYTDFIRPELESQGFEVARADDIGDENNRNILRDVIDGIAKCDLVIAELTGNNPNVLYELGLAHALRKPVLHLTQNLDEVPFDLRSYRMIEYSRDFSKIGEAKEKLISNAKAFSDGRSLFGNPITDFYSGPTPQETGGSAVPPRFSTGDRGPIEAIEDSATSLGELGDHEGDLGFLDHLVTINEGYGRAGEVAGEIAGSMEGLTNYMTEATTELQRITANRNASSPNAAITLCRRLARRFESFNGDIRTANATFAETIDNTEDSLEHLVAFQIAQSDSPDVVEALDELGNLRYTVFQTRSSILGFADAIDELPRVERLLNRQMNNTSIEIRAMAGHLDRIYGSISRAIQAAGAGPEAA